MAAFEHRTTPTMRSSHHTTANLVQQFATEPLGALAAASEVILAETYPAEAYGHVGVVFSPGGSKQRQADRQAASRNLIERCSEHRIELSAELAAIMEDGFGPRKSGEDPFDAVMGLLGMIEVVEGRRREAPAEIPDRNWEGWIFGREDP